MIEIHKVICLNQCKSVNWGVYLNKIELSFIHTFYVFQYT